MRSKIVQGSIIVILFLVCIVGEPVSTPKYFNEMYFGIVHINSLIFILVSAFILWLSIDSDIKDANKMHQRKEASTKEAKKIFEDFFEDKITMEQLVEKSKTNETVKKILFIIKYGGVEEDLVLGIEKVFTEISSKYIKLKNDYEYFATIMPILGMVGTIAGLLIMFATPDGNVENFQEKFAGLSLALATTLYASLITVLVFKPLARSVEEWLVSLDTDYQYCEVALKQFFHKVDVMELVQEMGKVNYDQEQ